MKYPTTYAETLELAKRAVVVDWRAYPAEISIYVDDVKADRRLVVRVRLDTGRVEYNTLCGFDPVRNRWAEYCQPSGEFTMANRRGEKALREWIRSKALEKYPLCPNPMQLSIYNGVTR